MSDNTKVLLDSDLNAFKNISVQRDELVLPASVGGNTTYTNTLNFTLQETANFIQAYVLATDYGQAFNNLPIIYTDIWRQLHSSAGFFGEFMILSSTDTVHSFAVNMILSGNNVQIILYINNLGFSGFTLSHPTFRVPVTFIEYTLDK